jgi:hypothetical protein
MDIHIYPYRIEIRLYYRSARMIIFVHRNRINRLIDDGEAQNLPEQRNTLSDANSSQPSSTSRSTYRRFKIDTCAVPPRRKLPRPFTPRVGRIGLASNLIREVFEHGFKLRERKYRRVLLTRPCIYGVFSGRFGGFHPIRDRCTGCMRCIQEFPQFCRVDRNPEFFRFADSYWIPEDPTTRGSSANLKLPTLEAICSLSLRGARSTFEIQQGRLRRTN